jgi:purine-nucleoside phosphorylase
MLKKTEDAALFIKRRIPENPETAIVLGSGLGGLIRDIQVKETIPYHEIPGFPVATVQGHDGKLIFGYLANKPVLALMGRFHYYEGYSLAEVTFPVRVLAKYGIKVLIMSNASGGLRDGFSAGDIMFIEDHINLLGNPLIGLNDKAYGERFVDMSRPYDPKLLGKASNIASKAGLSYHIGTYVGVTGPTYETPAEIAYYRCIGADAIGMSTVPEVIVANQLGLKVFAISVITNAASNPGQVEKVTHGQVIDAAATAEPRMTTIIKHLIQEL